MPAKLAGKTAACPSCGKPVRIGEEAEQAARAEPALDLDSIADTVSAETPPELKPEEDAAPAEAASLPDPRAARADAPRLLQGRLLENVFAGLFSGAILFLFCVGFAVLILPQPLLAEHLGCVLTVTLIGAAIVGAMYTAGSSVPFGLAGPEPTLCAALSLLAGSLHGSLAGRFPPHTIFATIVAALLLASLVTGLCTYLLGRLKTGDSVRYLPFQIMGGVSAGIGWFLLRRAFEYMAGVDISLPALIRAVQQQPLLAQFSSGDYLLWLPGLALGLILLAALWRTHNPLYLLLLLVAALGLPAALPYVRQLAPIAGSLAGLTAGPAPGLEQLLALFTPATLSLIHWPAILEHQAYIAVLPVLVATPAMFKVTNLETALGREVDLDHEFKALGRSNILAGLCGGLPGALSQTRSLGARAIGAKVPVAGLVAAASALLFLAYADAILPAVPKLLPAGLLVYLGLSLMKRWLLDARSEFTRTEDYLLLLTAFLATVSLGLVLGVGVGLAASLQFFAALPNFPERRFPSEPLFEYDRSPHPLRDGVTQEKLAMKDGCLDIPDRPGLGVTLDLDFVKRHAV